MFVISAHGGNCEIHCASDGNTLHISFRDIYFGKERGDICNVEKGGSCFCIISFLIVSFSDNACPRRGDSGAALFGEGGVKTTFCRIQFSPGIREGKTHIVQRFFGDSPFFIKDFITSQIGLRFLQVCFCVNVSTLCCEESCACIGLFQKEERIACGNSITFIDEDAFNASVHFGGDIRLPYGVKGACEFKFWHDGFPLCMGCGHHSYPFLPASFRFGVSCHDI